MGSRDVTAGDLDAIFRWLLDDEELDARDYAVLGIRHPLALARTDLELRPRGAYSMRGHSIGGFGSVTTNKLVATLCGDLFGLQVQAYPRYGSEKKGLPTTYFLTIAEEPIRQHAELRSVDFVPINDAAAFRYSQPLAGLVRGGGIFLNTPATDPEDIWATIPAQARADILSHHQQLYALDTVELARRHSPRPELTVRMQGVALVGVFLRLSPFAERAGLAREPLFAALRRTLGRYFGKRGSAVVDANLEVIREAYDTVIDVTTAIRSNGHHREEVLA